MRFQGKTALVTGASKGIGRATALRLAHEGAAVAVDEKPVGSIASGALLVRSVALGTHVVKVTTADQRTGSQEVTIAPERRNDVAIAAAASEPPPTEPPPAAAPVKAEEPRKESKTWTIVGASLVGGGLGMAGVGLGFGLYVKVLDQHPDLVAYRSHVPVGRGVCSYADSQNTDQASKVSDICNKSKTYEIMEWVFVATGLAAFVGGVVVLSLDLDHPSKGQDSAARLSMSPFVAGDQTGFSAQVDF